MNALTALRLDHHALCYQSAFVGGVVWLIVLAVLPLDWAPAFLLLAPLVLVPLALALVEPEPAPLWRAAVWLQLPAALLLVAAFALPAGPRAGAFSLPWFAFTALVALLGLARLGRRKGGPVEELAIDAGLIYLAVGGLWTLLSRWGARPMTFNEPIILLTGVHFHYAGLVLPLLTGLAGRQRHGTISQLAALGVVTGVPLVAVGINLSPLGFRLLEWVASTLLAAAGILTAVLHLRLVPRITSPVVRLLLAVSGLSLAVGMVLAALYALGMYWGRGWLDIPLMIHSHGAINALGFALPGLLAWNLTRPSSATPISPCPGCLQA